jgi:hypothetical protein
MPTQIQRYAPTAPGKVTFGTSAAASTTLCLSTAAAFSFLVPASATTTTVAWYASDRDEGPFYPVTLSNGNNATTSVVGGRVYIAPPELFACMYVRGVAGAAFDAVVMTKT